MNVVSEDKAQKTIQIVGHHQKRKVVKHVMVVKF